MYVNLYYKDGQLKTSNGFNSAKEAGDNYQPQEGWQSLGTVPDLKPSTTFRLARTEETREGAVEPGDDAIAEKMASDLTEYCKKNTIPHMTFINLGKSSGFYASGNGNEFVGLFSKVVRKIPQMGDYMEQGIESAKVPQGLEGLMGLLNHLFGDKSSKG